MHPHLTPIMGYLQFFMNYLSDGLGSRLPEKNEKTCFRVDLTENALLDLDCPHGYTLYVVVPTDFDDKCDKPIDWKCDEEDVELKLNGESRPIPFYTRVQAYASMLKMIPLQNELCVNTYAKSVLDLTPLSHIKNVTVYRYHYVYDTAQQKLHPYTPFYGAVLLESQKYLDLLVPKVEKSKGETFIDIAERVAASQPSEIQRYDCENGDGRLDIGLTEEGHMLIHVVEVVKDRRRTGILRRFVNQLHLLGQAGVTQVWFLAVGSHILDAFLAHYKCPTTGASFRCQGGDFGMEIKTIEKL